MDQRAHTKLDVWKRSMDFAKEIYLITNKFPSSELYGLTSQMRRAAVSVPSNLVEGAARKGTKEFKQFFGSSPCRVHEIMPITL